MFTRARRMQHPLLLLLLVAATALASSPEVSAAAPGEQLAAVDGSGQQSQLPPGFDFLRIASGECIGCLKECLGAKVQAAQAKAAEYQAPMSLLFWYLFKNRPFRNYPLEEFVAQLFKVPIGAVAVVAAVAYKSCQQQCDLECPFPGSKPAATAGDGAVQPTLPELSKVDASNFAPIYALLHRRSARGGGKLASAFSGFFRM